MARNWPDSEDLLQSILSADLSSWAPLEASPFPPPTSDPLVPLQTVLSPWTQSADDSQPHGGEEAVHDLSRMIKRVVRELLPKYESLLTWKVHRRHNRSSIHRTDGKLPRHLFDDVLDLFRANFPGCASANVCVQGLDTAVTPKRNRAWILEPCSRRRQKKGISERYLSGIINHSC